jgi:hypothetical protein
VYNFVSVCLHPKDHSRVRPFFVEMSNDMASEVKTSRVGAVASVSIGERVTLGDSDTEYVVVSVDHATGRLELLRLRPGGIESDVPASAVRKKATGPQVIVRGDD